MIYLLILVAISFLIFSVLLVSFTNKYLELLVLLKTFYPIIVKVKEDLQEYSSFKELTIKFVDDNLRRLAEVEENLQTVANNLGVLAVAVDFQSGYIPIGHRLNYLESTVLSDPRFQLIYSQITNPAQNEMGS